MCFNTSVHSPLSLCQSLSLSLYGATPVLSPAPSLLLSYPVRHLPFLCALPVSHGYAFIIPCVWVSCLIYMQTFPTCHMCLLCASCASCPGYAYLCLLGFPTLVLSSSVPSCHSHGSAPHKHASSCFMLLHELSSSHTSSLTLHGSLTPHKGFSPSFLLIFSISQSCLLLLMYVFFLLYVLFTSSLTYFFPSLTYLSPSLSPFSPHLYALLLIGTLLSSFECSHLAAPPLYASPSHASNSHCSCTFFRLQACKCSPSLI